MSQYELRYFPTESRISQAYLGRQHRVWTTVEAVHAFGQMRWCLRGF